MSPTANRYVEDYTNTGTFSPASLHQTKEIEIPHADASFAPGFPLVIAHRGASGEAPENTLASFQLALEQGCDAIELDIHLSKDQEIVVCHDASLRRTTTGLSNTGSQLIHEMTVKEIKRADAGAWFHEKYQGERIPLLQEVFDIIPPEIMINIEIKAETGGLLEARLIELLEQNQRSEHVVISSFSHKALFRLKQLKKELAIGLLYASNLLDHTVIIRPFERYWPELAPVFSLHPHYLSIGREDIQAARHKGLHIYPYTVDQEAVWKQLIDWGVSGIITNFPGKLCAYMNAH